MINNNTKQQKKVSAKQLEANRKNAQKSTGPKDTSLTRFNALKHGILSKEVVITVGDGKEDEDEFNNLLGQLQNCYIPQGAMEEMLVEKIAVSYWRLRRALRYERGMLRERLDSLYYDYYNQKTWGGEKVNEKVDYDTLRVEQERLNKEYKECIELLRQGLDLSESQEDNNIDIEEYYYTLIEEEYRYEYWSNPDLDKNHNLEEEMKISNIRAFLMKKGWTDNKLRENFIQQDMERIERCKSEIKEIDEQENAEKLKLSRMVDKESLLPVEEINKLLKYEGTIEKQLYRAINQLERLQRMRLGEAVPPPIQLDISSDK